MGRKAKLKKKRKSSPKKVDNSGANSDEFVKHLERQGYSLKNPKVAPDMPDKKIEPQV
ncbi:hypothetical protein [Crocosphaera watsonii]|uniref:Glucosamine-6-phosphate deaminase n=1 Tax=Crocosphaera watsonii WH 0401 TaxID=555881 RepID=T2JGE6_CROWT|nr:hypothetical protein [Crocosphaera watsonii]CCQ64134.1 glucosamine-6-phosphate deaminase [Crocosphaera watsonii WH 0401]